MHRRDFIERAAATALAAGTPSVSSAASPPKRKANLKLGSQHSTADAVLKVMAALGVNNICSNLPSAKMDAAWSVEGLTKLRERVESHGLRLDMVPLPLSSAYITRSENPNIMLGKSPERDREIDNICQMIRNVARAGIPAVKYNMSILGVVRTESHAGARRLALQHLRLRQGEAGSAADRGRPRDRRRLLGAHHLLPGARRAGGRGVQGEDGLPSARSRHAARQRFPRRRAGAGQRRRLKRFIEHQARTPITG